MGNGHMGTPPLNRMTDRHLGKHYLPAAWFAASSEGRETAQKSKSNVLASPLPLSAKKLRFPECPQHLLGYLLLTLHSQTDKISLVRPRYRPKIVAKRQKQPLLTSLQLALLVI